MDNATGILQSVAFIVVAIAAMFFLNKCVSEETKYRSIGECLKSHTPAECRDLYGGNK